jgi:uncharacterized membrane protein YdfJ with MMPL/SSD domain
VLLDTFVVRPILVPAYLILVANGRLSWRRFAGKTTAAPAETPPTPQTLPKP